MANNIAKLYSDLVKLNESGVQGIMRLGEEE
jgi:hypothetical protein